MEDLFDPFTQGDDWDAYDEDELLEDEALENGTMDVNTSRDTPTKAGGGDNLGKGCRPIMVLHHWRLPRPTLKGVP